VDAGAASLIRQALIDLAQGGASVLVISQDLDELFEIADRMAVIFHGRLSPAYPVHDLTREAVGLLMGGEGFAPLRRRGRLMALALERRTDAGPWALVLSPLLAVALTLASSVVIFWLLGQDPWRALTVYFLMPISDSWGLQEVAVKATPLVLIAVGLALCFRSNNWNIGAEGQFLIGAICGGGVAVWSHGSGGPWVLPLMLAAGALGGMAYALIPAVLKVRLRVNEILVSLMLVYVADLLLDYLVRGPWRDPQGFNMPQTVTFAPDATLPLLFEGGRMNLGSVIALIVVAVAAVVMARTLKGFEIRLVGEAPRAARFAGFSDTRLTLTVFAVSGALAGLAGVMEAAGTVRQLLPGFSPGYGFTAIIVAFLGRLNPVGCLIAGIFIAITFIGGENAQIMLRLPRDMTLVFQGLLLFYILACDTLILYRLRPAPRRARHDARDAILLTVITAATPLLIAAHRRTGGGTLGRPEPRRRGDDDHGRGLGRGGRHRDGVEPAGRARRHRRGHGAVG
jgi:general nucleoside transport system permease protein